MRTLILATALITFSNISFGQITLQSPNGGEIWQVGSTQTINYTNTGSTTAALNMSYSSDSGATWSPVPGGIYIKMCPPGTGTYSWTIPNTPSTKCLYRVWFIINSVTYSDTSDAVFEISTTAGLADSKYSLDDVYSVLYNKLENNIHVKWDSNVSFSTKKIQLYDVMGALVKEAVVSEPTSYTTSISSNGIAKGIYYLSIDNGNKRVVKKILVN